MPCVYFPESITARRIGVGRQAHIISFNYLDYIWYAARNRLCVEIKYHSITRLVEPYSLNQPNTGNLLLYVYELTKGPAKSGDIRAYKIEEIESANVVQQAFSPRYVVEL